MRILIAEDDRTSRDMLRAVLEKVGHEVVQVTGGRAALETMQGSCAPRLAILDWMMPDIDGPEICRRLRDSENPEPPYIIMLTTRSGRDDVIEGLTAGANDYLCKPFDPRELHARIEVGRRMLEMQSRLIGTVRKLRGALDQVKVLRGILPICARCKKIRNDDGYWEQVDVYMRQHTDVEFSHGICPECIAELYPDESHEVRAPLTGVAHATGLCRNVHNPWEREHEAQPGRPGPAPKGVLMDAGVLENAQQVAKPGGDDGVKLEEEA